MKKLYSIVFTAIVLAGTFKNAGAQSLALQSSFNVTDSVSGGGNSGIVYTGTEFWVSKWYTDSIASLNPAGSVTGRFIVPGVTGIRAMTWDGAFIYAAVNSNIIYKINPTTKVQVGTIVVPHTIRHISYSAAANGGAGGFWIGDNAGDIRLVDFAGTTLRIIPEATHGLGRMWGSALDSTTNTGGPFLWIFDRGATFDQAYLKRIPLSTGVPDFTYNVLNDFPNGGIAVGAYNEL